MSSAELHTETMASATKARGPLYWMSVAIVSSCVALACFFFGVGLKFSEEYGSLLFGLAVLLEAILCYFGIRWGLRSLRENKLEKGRPVVSVFARIAIGLSLFQILCGIVLGGYEGYQYAKNQILVTDRQIRLQCLNNMKAIGISIQLYANDNEEKAPSNWLVLTNELASPKWLICPADSWVSAARNWTYFRPDNVSYTYLLAGSNRTNSELGLAPLLLCPIHHHLVLGDGSVFQGDGGGIALGIATNWPRRSELNRSSAKERKAE